MCSSERCKAFLSGFGLLTSDAGVFCRTQWKLPWILWAIYRIILTLSYTVFAVFIFAYDGQFYTIKYLSNWVLFIGAIFYIIATTNLFVDRKYGRNYHGTENKDELPHIDLTWRHKFQWIVTNAFINASFLVMIVYWAALNPGFATKPLLISYDLFEHIFPSILGVIEIFMTPVPIRFQHFTHPVIFMLTYILVTVIFYYGGNPKYDPVYSILDYGDPGTATVVILGCAVLAVVLQLVFWAMYRCKLLMITRCCPSYSTEANPSEVNNAELNLEVQKV